ncbi:MAG: hypothetical protein M3511_00715 [Deinococcota bacterium]|nr:hypothetical protein [Deinococcota bacterium]
MYAAVGVWNMEAGNWEEQQRGLHEDVIPMVKKIPGFVAGYWMADETARKTYTTIVWEDEAAAQRFASFVLGEMRREKQGEAGIKNESMTVVKVLAEARL